MGSLGISEGGGTANCHFSLSLTESCAGAKVGIMQGTHSHLNTGHEAMQLEFNLSGTDVNTKGTCVGPLAKCRKHKGGKPEQFGAHIPVDERLMKNVSVHCQ